jgi:hypothetical protein
MASGTAWSTSPSKSGRKPSSAMTSGTGLITRSSRRSRTSN